MATEENPSSVPAGEKYARDLERIDTETMEALADLAIPGVIYDRQVFLPDVEESSN